MTPAAWDLVRTIAFGLMFSGLGLGFGHAIGFRRGRREGFRSGKVHGRYWARVEWTDKPQ